MPKAVSIAIREKEAENLKRILSSRGYGKDGLTFAHFAATAKIPGGKSMLSQHLTLTRPISIEAAKAYASFLKCEVREISERIANLLQDSPARPPQELSAKEPESRYNVIAPDFSDSRIKQVVEMMLATDTEGRIKALEAVKWALKDHTVTKKGLAR